MADSRSRQTARTDGGAAPQTGLVRSTAVIVLTALAIVGLAGMMWTYPQVPFLAFAAVLVAVALDAAAGPLRTRIGLPRVPAVLLVAALAAVLTIVGVWLAAPRISDQATQLVDRIPAALNRAEEWLANQGWTPAGRDGSGQGSLQSWSAERVTQLISDWWKTVAGALATTVSVLGAVLLVVVAAVFLAIDPDLYRGGAIRLVPPRGRDRAEEILQRMAEGLRWWLAGRITAMVAVAILTQLGLWALGIRLSFVLAAIAGVLTFVPYIGPILAGAPAVMAALAEAPSLALWVAGLYFAIQLIENNLLTPLIQQRAVSLPPVLLIFAQLWLGLAFGMLGLLFAAPVAVLAMIAVQKLYIEDTLREEPVGDASSE